MGLYQQSFSLVFCLLITNGLARTVSPIEKLRGMHAYFDGLESWDEERDEIRRSSTISQIPLRFPSLETNIITKNTDELQRELRNFLPPPIEMNVHIDNMNNYFGTSNIIQESLIDRQVQNQEKPKESDVESNKVESEEKQKESDVESNKVESEEKQKKFDVESNKVESEEKQKESDVESNKMESEEKQKEFDVESNKVESEEQQKESDVESNKLQINWMNTNDVVSDEADDGPIAQALVQLTTDGPADISTFELIERALSWEEAQKNCQSLGGHLAEITTAQKQLQVLGLLKNLSPGYTYTYWIGGRCSSSECGWEASGTDIDSGFKTWDFGEPFLRYNHRCVVLRMLAKTWETANCGLEMFSICQYNKN